MLKKQAPSIGVWNVVEGLVILSLAAKFEAFLLSQLDNASVPFKELISDANSAWIERLLYLPSSLTGLLKFRNEITYFKKYI